MARLIISDAAFLLTVGSFLLTVRWFHKRVVFQKGGFGSAVPPERKPERGYVRMSPGSKTGTRVHWPKPPCYETALPSPLEQWSSFTYN